MQKYILFLYASNEYMNIELKYKIPLTNALKNKLLSYTSLKIWAEYVCWNYKMLAKEIK